MKKIDTKWFYLLYFVAYLLLFFIVEKVVPSDADYWIVDLPIDRAIPFVPWMVIFYISWYAFMLYIMIYLFIHESKNFKKFFNFLGLGYVVCFIIFIAFPNGQNLRPEINEMGSDFFSSILKTLYSADTNTNVLPSMHVFGTVGGVFAVYKSEGLSKKLLKIVMPIWGLLIILSIFFVKQHSVLDAIVSIAMAIPIYILIYSNILKRRSKKTDLTQV